MKKHLTAAVLTVALLLGVAAPAGAATTRAEPRVEPRGFVATVHCTNHKKTVEFVACVAKFQMTENCVVIDGVAYCKQTGN